MHNAQLMSFNSISDAWVWILSSVDEPVMKNYRFAYEDDRVGSALYDSRRAMSRGLMQCDETVVIRGRRARIGLDYTDQLPDKHVQTCNNTETNQAHT